MDNIPIERIAVYPKDLQGLIGKSERYCRQLLRQIRITYNKHPPQIITLTECARYLKIPAEELESLRSRIFRYTR